MNVLQFVGESTVASTKQTNSTEVFVYAPLLFPTAEGGINADVERVKKKAVDANGKAVSTDQLQSGKVVPATWKPIGEPNRVTAPDVMEGSKVSLYQFAGSSEYFWTTFGFAADTMRLETVIYGWNGEPNRGENADYDISKFYTLTMSPRDGMVSFRNSNANGEKAIIDTNFNYMEGRVVISGSHGGNLILDDVEHSFVYTNAEESILMVERENISAVAKGGVLLQTDDNIVIKTDQLVMQATNIQIEVEGETQITSPKTTHAGNLIVDGTIGSTGGITSDAKVIGKGGVQSGTTDMDQHRHSDGNDGNPTGIPIEGSV